MKLALSNLAWDNPFDEHIMNVLKEKKINFIEGVLTKIDDWENLTEYKIYEYKKLLDKYNLKVKSIQSIFFNTKIDSLCDTKNVIKHIEKVLIFCKILNVDILVFGSPSLRKNLDSYNKIYNTFLAIDELLISTDIMLTIEPNAKIYGGVYFNTMDDIIDFLNRWKFKKIGTMIDTHNLLLENENPNYILNKYFEYINHIHISETNLQPLQNFNFHKQFSETIKNVNYKNLITYEVNQLFNFEKNIDEFIKIYS
jgi:sugar phosphate isomerase/epimerase